MSFIKDEFGNPIHNREDVSAEAIISDEQGSRIATHAEALHRLGFEPTLPAGIDPPNVIRDFDDNPSGEFFYQYESGMTAPAWLYIREQLTEQHVGNTARTVRGIPVDLSSSIVPANAGDPESDWVTAHWWDHGISVTFTMGWPRDDTGAGTLSEREALAWDIIESMIP